MRVPDQIKKCVVFIGCRKFDGSYELKGSAFIFGDDSSDPKYAYFVTARHVIDGIEKLGVDKVWLRVNAKSGGCEWVSTDLSKWARPKDPSLDVALLFGYLNTEADHMILHRQWALTPATAQNLNIGIGDSVFITGLFANHPGELRNVPIVRIGNLAAYPEERIRVPDFNEMDAYLIEARSIGGLSGSPVFYQARGSHLGVLRPFAPEWLNPAQPDDQPFHLMGIVHGHFTRKENSEVEKLNTGIAIVVPISGILGFIDETRASRVSV